MRLKLSRQVQSALCSILKPYDRDCSWNVVMSTMANAPEAKNILNQTWITISMRSSQGHLWAARVLKDERVMSYGTNGGELFPVGPGLIMGQEIRQNEAKSSRLYCEKSISCLFCGFSNFTVCLRMSLLSCYDTRNVVLLCAGWHVLQPMRWNNNIPNYRQKSLKCFSRFLQASWK